MTVTLDREVYYVSDGVRKKWPIPFCVNDPARVRVQTIVASTVENIHYFSVDLSTSEVTAGPFAAGTVVRIFLTNYAAYPEEYKDEVTDLNTASREIASILARGFHEAFRGDWIDTETYRAGEIVRYGDKLWVALQPNQNLAPSLSSTSWGLLIDTAVIPDGNVTTSKLADSSVTPEKLDRAYIPIVETLADLRNLNPTFTYVRLLGRTVSGDGGGGLFAWRSGDQSANVSADPAHGVWVPSSPDITGASGAWERLFASSVKPEWFGGLVEADSYAYSNGHTLNVDRLISVEDDTNIYSTVCVNGGGGFNVEAGKALYINGNVIADDYKIFYGDGNVYMLPTGNRDNTTVRAAWFGANEGSDATTGIQKACDALSLAGEGIVQLTAGVFHVYSTIVVPRAVKILGAHSGHGLRRTVISWHFEGSPVFDLSDDQAEVLGIQFEYGGNNTSPRNGLDPLIVCRGPNTKARNIIASRTGCIVKTEGEYAEVSDIYYWWNDYTTADETAIVWVCSPRSLVENIVNRENATTQSPKYAVLVESCDSDIDGLVIDKIRNYNAKYGVCIRATNNIKNITIDVTENIEGPFGDREATIVFETNGGYIRGVSAQLITSAGTRKSVVLRANNGDIVDAEIRMNSYAGTCDVDASASGGIIRRVNVYGADPERVCISGDVVIGVNQHESVGVRKRAVVYANSSVTINVPGVVYTGVVDVSANDGSGIVASIRLAAPEHVQPIAKSGAFANNDLELLATGGGIEIKNNTNNDKTVFVKIDYIMR